MALVLLVDDSPDTRRFYKSCLIRCGYQVVSTGDGRTAVRLAQTRRPDVIVMDLAMPVIDGIEASKQIHADDRTSKIPIIAVTGYAWKTVARIAAQAGFAAFVAKPCASIELVTTIDQVLARIDSSSCQRA